MQAVEAIAMERVQQGDADSFRVLVEQHSRVVFRLAFRLTGNEADAEEVVQETFLRAYRNIGRYDPRAKISTWLCSIASNYAVDLLRRRKHRRAESLDDLAPRHAPVATAPDPERGAVRAELRRRLEHAMSDLTPREQAAFALRHFEGMSIRDIAFTTGFPEGSVKNNIFRAVRKLRAMLGPDGAK